MERPGRFFSSGGSKSALKPLQVLYSRPESSIFTVNSAQMHSVSMLAGSLRLLCRTHLTAALMLTQQCRAYTGHLLTGWGWQYQAESTQ